MLPRLTMKSWSEDDQPREKMMQKGPTALSDAELLSILIGSGSADLSALDLSKQILLSVDYNLLEFSRISLSDFLGFNGIGPAKAARLLAALEIGRRKQLSAALSRTVISSSEDAAKVLRPLIGDLLHEEFWALYMNNRNELLDRRRISKGGLSSTVADPRQVFQIALEQRSTAIIIAHNHPSGSLKPSASDHFLTKQMKEAGKILQVEVLDHLIISSSSYYSYCDEGRI